MAAELAIAPVTLGCTAVLLGVARLTRWPPRWLAGPAIIGAGWALLAGPGRAAAGFAVAGAQVAAFLAAPGAVPAHLARLPEAIFRWRAALAGQLPLALIAAAAQAAAAGGIRGHLGPVAHRSRGDKTGLGLLGAARRAYRTALVRRGDFATVDGACLGIERDTGRPAGLSWADASGGVLITGQDRDSVTSTGLDLVRAAIQHRKAVIIVDLAASPGPVAAAIADACSDHGARLRTVLQAGELAGGAGANPASTPRGRRPRPGTSENRAGSADRAAGPGTAGPSVFAEVLALRQVLLAQPGSRGPEAAAGLARFIVSGLAAALAERRALGVPADGLAWVSGCERAGAGTLEDLLACPRDVGVPISVGTAAGSVASRLAGELGAIAIRGQPPGGWAGSRPDGREGPGTPDTGTTDLPELPARLLAGRAADDLAVLVRGPAPRLHTNCQALR
ncbi:MAG: hypothetical protein ACR2FU_24125 [Streptosporangiaceae bacterium]